MSRATSPLVPALVLVLIVCSVSSEADVVVDTTTFLETSDALPLMAEVIGLSDGDRHLAAPLDEVWAPARRRSSWGGVRFRLEPRSVGVRAFDEAGAAIPVSQSFWFAWYGRHHDTEI